MKVKMSKHSSGSNSFSSDVQSRKGVQNKRKYKEVKVEWKIGIGKYYDYFTCTNWPLLVLQSKQHVHSTALSELCTNLMRRLLSEQIL